MKIRKAYRYRLKTSPELETQLSKAAGACRFVWNHAWAMNKRRLEQKQRLLGYQELAFWLKFWKQSDEYAFLKEAHSQVLQQTLKDLDRAMKDGFDKSQPLKRIPVFKKKGGARDSFRYPQGFKLKGNRVYLPKIGWVRFFKSRDIDGTPKNVTVSRQAGHWYVSIQVELEVAEPRHPATGDIGIDMGVTNFATLSNGEVIEPLNSFRRLEKRLSRSQRRLSRKQKFSSNWKRQRIKLQKIHRDIANARKDFLHKTSTQISKNHAMIVIEDLKVRNMSASAKGDLEQPGRNVKAKTGLNKSILDQGWYEFRRQLDYKQAWRGGLLVAIPPQHTSQTCVACGHVSADNRKTQSAFHCVVCSYSDNADVNAARNILAVGHTVLACGEAALATSVKQEPPVHVRAA